MNGLVLPIPEEFLGAFEELIRRAVAAALTTEGSTATEGFLDVAGAAAYITSTPTAIRALVKRREIPYYKAPNGRLLFDRAELEMWVRHG